MDVSIIIVNYKTADLITECITSIKKHTKGVSYEIIVVDNNSMDGGVERIGLAFPSSAITFVELGENKGFGMANNEGFKVSKGRNILCLNPDTLLMNDAISELSEFLDSNKNVGACGGNLYDGAEKPTHSFSMVLPSIEWELDMLFFAKLEKTLHKGNASFNHTGRPMPVGYITGADLMVRRDVFEKAGGFSPKFFMYYEDTDLCYRIGRLGYKLMSVPSAKIMHLEGQSFGKGKVSVNERRIRMSEKGRLVYYRKNKGRGETAAANAIYLAALLINELVFRCLKHEAWKVYRCKRKIFTEIRNQRF